MFLQFCVCVFIAILLSIPYRKLKLRYKLLSYEDSSETIFYGTDEMAREYNERLNKLKNLEVVKK